MMKLSTTLILVAGVSWLAPSAQAQSCPAGTYRMLIPGGYRCVPYADGGRHTPGPGPNKSTITGPSGAGGNGQRGAPAASAR